MSLANAVSIDGSEVAIALVIEALSVYDCAIAFARLQNNQG
jgi:hypothetical protein